MQPLFNAWGPVEWILLIFIILILFGSKRIPEIARSFGEAVREFRKAMSEAEQATRPQQTASIQQTQVKQDDPLLELARRKGISVEGKSRIEIVEELAKKIREEESNASA